MKSWPTSSQTFFSMSRSSGLEFDAVFAQFPGVDDDALLLHFGEHGDERHFHVPENILELFALEFFAQEKMQAEREVGVLRRITRSRGDGHGIEGLAFFNHRFVTEPRQAEEPFRQAFEGEGIGFGVDDPGCYHSVEDAVADRESDSLHYMEIVLYVVSDDERFRREQSLQLTLCGINRDGRRIGRLERNVESFLGSLRKRKADDVRHNGIDAVRFRVEGESSRGDARVHEGAEFLLGRDRHVCSIALEILGRKAGLGRGR